MARAVTRKIRIDAPSGRYDVTIGDGILARTGQTLAPLVGGARIAVVTDRNVSALFASQMLESLEAPGFFPTLIEIPAGEQSKDWSRAGEVVERLAAAGLDRTDAVVALGGGVVGDLAGFCAAVYLRGISFVQVPTTLLAQVDSSIGGKTAVDLSAGKNLAGAFIQPRAVIADVSTLASLPDTEWLSGLGEVAKTAVLDGEGFLGWLEDHAAQLLARDAAVVEAAVVRCVEFKGSVVSADERESGRRESLNLGHTLGHAIEREAGYGAVPHGLAVADGMRFAARLAVRSGRATVEFEQRQSRLLDRLGLVPTARAWDADALRFAMGSDKKSRGGVPRFVLPHAPGVWDVAQVDEGLLAEELRAWARGEGG